MRRTRGSPVARGSRSRHAPRAALLLLLAALVRAGSVAVVYERQPFEPQLDGYHADGGRAVLHESRRAALQKWTNATEVPPGVWNGHSRVDLTRLRVTRPAAVAQAFPPDTDTITGTVHAVLLKLPSNISIARNTSSGSRLCCSPADAQASGCEVNRLFPPEHLSNHSWLRVVDLHFHGAATVARPAAKFITIEETGMHSLKFFTCDPALDAARIEGHTAWKSPTGYLPMVLPGNERSPVDGLETLAALLAFLGLWSAAHARCLQRRMWDVAHAVRLLAALGTAASIARLAGLAIFNCQEFVPSPAPAHLLRWQLAAVATAAAAGATGWLVTLAGSLRVGQLPGSSAAAVRPGRWALCMAAAYACALALTLMGQRVENGQQLNRAVGPAATAVALEIGFLVVSLRRVLLSRRLRRAMRLPHARESRWMLWLLAARAVTLPLVSLSAVVVLDALRAPGWASWHNMLWRKDLLTSVVETACLCAMFCPNLRPARRHAGMFGIVWAVVFKRLRETGRLSAGRMLEAGPAADPELVKPAGAAAVQSQSPAWLTEAWQTAVLLYMYLVCVVVCMLLIVLPPFLVLVEKSSGSRAMQAFLGVLAGASGALILIVGGSVLETRVLDLDVRYFKWVYPESPACLLWQLALSPGRPL